jgi:drug/metabolite transporter (DMT)-like permease
MTSSQRSGILLLVLAAAGYAMMPIITRTAFEQGIAPLDLTIWRFILATPAIWAILLINRAQGRERANDLPLIPMLLLGGLFAVTALTAFFALQRIPASTYTVLLYTYPAIVALLLLVMGESLSRRGWLALALTLVGILLTVPNLGEAFDNRDPVGMLLALANGAVYAVFIVLSSRVLRGKEALITASALNITGALLLLLLLVLFNSVQIPSSPALWGLLVALVLFSTIMPVICFYAGMQRVGAGQAAILSTLEPVMVLVLAFVLLRETMLPLQLVGGALILASAVLLQLPEKRDNI